MVSIETSPYAASDAKTVETRPTPPPPVVSVITPCYNSARYVGETIESVRHQTFTNWEHIVVDDGSSDDSACVVAEKAAADLRVRLVRQPNAGFRASTPGSRYLLFLDADDLLEPQMLETIVAQLEAHPEVGMVHTAFNFLQNDGKISTLSSSSNWPPRRVPTRWGMRVLPPTEPETPFVSIFVLASILPSVCAFRRTVYETTPGWDENMGLIYEDVSLYLHMALRSKVHYVPQKLAQYRIHGSQVSTHSDRFFQQEQKLYAHWAAMRFSDPQWQATVDAAIRFHKGRVLAWQGSQTGLREIKRGAWKSALRFWGGAARRYVASLLPVLPRPTSAKNGGGTAASQEVSPTQ